MFALRRYIWKRVLPYTKSCAASIVVLIAVSALSFPVSLVSPYFVKYLIDNVMYSGKLSAFGVVAGGMLGAYVMRLILDGLALHCSNKIQNRFTYRLRRDIWEEYFRMDYRA